MRLVFGVVNAGAASLSAVAEDGTTLSARYVLVRERRSRLYRRCCRASTSLWQFGLRSARAAPRDENARQAFALLRPYHEQRRN